MQKAIQLLTLVLLLTTLNSCGYNKMVEMDEDVKGAWSQVINVYEYRASLAPALIKAVKEANALTSEQIKTLESSTQKATEAMKDKTPSLNEDYLKAFESSQIELTKSIDKVFEASRKDQRVDEFANKVQSNAVFEDLLASLTSAEVRIKTERKKYNKEVTEYNKYIRSMPQKATSGIMGFGELPLYGMQAN